MPPGLHSSRSAELPGSTLPTACSAPPPTPIGTPALSASLSTPNDSPSKPSKNVCLNLACLDEVLLPTWRPGAPVGVNLGEAHLINVGQSDFTFSRATPKLFDLDLSGSEGGFITFFLESGGSASTPCRTTSMLLSRCPRSLVRHRSVRAGPAAVWPSMALRLPLQRSWPTALA